jgi:hypothetical protein
MSLIAQARDRAHSSDCEMNAQRPETKIILFFKGVASIPRAAAWNLLCHSVTEAVVITRLVRNRALERVIQDSRDSGEQPPIPRPEFTFGIL